MIKGDEPSILKEFWELATDVELLVGFNVIEFDLKYIWQRSVIHRGFSSKYINFARYRSEQIYDVMEEWEKWGRNISLNELSKALGIQSPKGELVGSKVYGHCLAGKLQDSYDYCLADVVATREIYRRINFI